LKRRAATCLTLLHLLTSQECIEDLHDLFPLEFLVFNDHHLKGFPARPHPVRDL